MRHSILSSITKHVFTAPRFSKSKSLLGGLFAAVVDGELGELHFFGEPIGEGFAGAAAAILFDVLGQFFLKFFGGGRNDFFDSEDEATVARGDVGTDFAFFQFSSGGTDRAGVESGWEILDEGAGVA